MRLTSVVYTEAIHLLQMLNEGKRLLENNLLEQLNHISTEMWQKLAGMIKDETSVTKTVRDAVEVINFLVNYIT